jgi:hypothetical protein
MNMDLYDKVEVHAVTRMVYGDEECFETCDPEEVTPYCWSVYLHLKCGGVECVADCPNEGTAELIAQALKLKLKERS